MANWHALPRNDADLRGIYEYLSWRFDQSGFDSGCFHFLSVLYREATKESILTPEAFKKCVEEYMHNNNG